jgi:hypothetical protein
LGGLSSNNNGSGEQNYTNNDSHTYVLLLFYYFLSFCVINICLFTKINIKLFLKNIFIFIRRFIFIISSRLLNTRRDISSHTQKKLIYVAASNPIQLESETLNDSWNCQESFLEYPCLLAPIFMHVNNTHSG